MSTMPAETQTITCQQCGVSYAVALSADPALLICCGHPFRSWRVSATLPPDAQPEPATTDEALLRTWRLARIHSRSGIRADLAALIETQTVAGDALADRLRTLAAEKKAAEERAERAEAKCALLVDAVRLVGEGQWDVAGWELLVRAAVANVLFDIAYDNPGPSGVMDGPQVRALRERHKALIGERQGTADA